MNADMTLAEALALADQDSPMPHLAGRALKVLRAELLALRSPRHSSPIPPPCSKEGCMVFAWMPCAHPHCPKNASANEVTPSHTKDC